MWYLLGSFEENNPLNSQSKTAFKKKTQCPCKQKKVYGKERARIEMIDWMRLPTHLRTVNNSRFISWRITRIEEPHTDAEE